MIKPLLHSFGFILLATVFAGGCVSPEPATYTDRAPVREVDTVSSNDPYRIRLQIIKDVLDSETMSDEERAYLKALYEYVRAERAYESVYARVDGDLGRAENLSQSAKSVASRARNVETRQQAESIRSEALHLRSLFVEQGNAVKRLDRAIIWLERAQTECDAMIMPLDEASLTRITTWLLSREEASTVDNADSSL